jgi:hypothetical protein
MVHIYLDPSSKEERDQFVFSFFMKNKPQPSMISFIEVQGLLTILCSRIDQELVKQQEQRLVDRILEKILVKIHRPSAISPNILK